MALASKELSSDEYDFEEEKVDANLNFANFPNLNNMERKSVGITIIITHLLNIGIKET